RKLERESPAAPWTWYLPSSIFTKVLGVVDTAQAASKSRRKLTIHFVGTEKELNIIPLFSELALLIPNTDILMIFFGQACKKLCDITKERYPRSVAAKGTVFEYTAPPLLGANTLGVEIDGRHDLYNNSFADAGGDDPDALISENAGLFAYMTW
ncbi:hypothetical protein DFH09DRAFT_885557, partial [Mycena vulgaris]